MSDHSTEKSQKIKDLRKYLKENDTISIDGVAIKSKLVLSVLNTAFVSAVNGEELSLAEKILVSVLVNRKSTP